MALSAAVLVTHVIAATSLQMPSWNTTFPNISINASAGLPPIAQTTFTIYNHTLQDNGTYNNGPIAIFWKGYFYVSWYNTMTGKESTDMRVLYATSRDAQHWSAPMVAFSNLTRVGEENEPWLLMHDRLYCSASMYNYPFQPLMRRLTGPTNSDAMGAMFWLTDTVPPGLERECNVTYRDMDSETEADMAQYLASLVKTETLPGGDLDTVTFNERSLYLVPNTSAPDTQQLMLLLRTNDERDAAREYQWAATCVNHVEAPVAVAQQECRPGIGVLKWNMVNTVAGSAQNVHDLQRWYVIVWV